MSQEKVDAYKEQKRNREKIMKRQKREKLLVNIGLAVFGVIIFGWAGVSAYYSIKGSKGAEEQAGATYTVDYAAVDDYMSGLSE